MTGERSRTSLDRVTFFFVFFFSSPSSARVRHFYYVFRRQEDATFAADGILQDNRARLFASLPMRKVIDERGERWLMIHAGLMPINERRV